MVVALGAFQQMEGDEAGHVLEMAVAVEPDLLEIGFRAFAHFEAIHGNEHASQLLFLAGTNSGESPDL